MTVLAKYQRLEAEGIWHPEPEAQRRDVIVSIGDATITISAPNGTALTHWSLPAVQRLNPGAKPALYGPGGDAPDVLELTDTEMVAAVEKVLKAVRQSHAHPGRLKGLSKALIIAVLGFAALVWIPDAIVRYTASLVPTSGRTSIGTALLSEVQRLTGEPCSDASGLAALTHLEARLFPGEKTPLTVLPSTLAETAHLPDGAILISHRLVEDHETPEALAGFLLAEDLRRDISDPLAVLLYSVGLRPALGLLSKGRLPDEALRRMAEGVVARAPLGVDDDALLARLHAAGIPGTAYALARDISGETTGALIEDGMTAVPPVLDDGDWIALQRICEN